MPGTGASLAPVKTLTGEKTLTLHGYFIGNRKYIKQWKNGIALRPTSDKSSSLKKIKSQSTDCLLQNNGI
jgi:hypothetical protein